jgi:hypothetical protein
MMWIARQFASSRHIGGGSPRGCIGTWYVSADLSQSHFIVTCSRAFWFGVLYVAIHQIDGNHSSPTVYHWTEEEASLYVEDSVRDYYYSCSGERFGQIRRVGCHMIITTSGVEPMDAIPQFG